MNLPATSPEKPGGKASYHNGTQHLPIINLFPFTIPILSFRMEHYVAKIEGRESLSLSLTKKALTFHFHHWQCKARVFKRHEV